MSVNSPVISSCIFLFSLIALSSCDYHNREDFYPCNEDYLNYDCHIQYIIDKNCATSGCHNSSNEELYHLSTYENVYRMRMDIQKRAIIDKTMPKGGSLSNTEYDDLRDWINQGALEK